MIWTILGILALVVQVIVLFMFCFVAGYVLVTGKAKSGIDMDFFYFSLVCGMVLIVL